MTLWPQEISPKQFPICTRTHSSSARDTSYCDRWSRRVVHLSVSEPVWHVFALFKKRLSGSRFCLWSRLLGAYCARWVPQFPCVKGSGVSKALSTVQFINTSFPTHSPDSATFNAASAKLVWLFVSLGSGAVVACLANPNSSLGYKLKWAKLQLGMAATAGRVTCGKW